MTSLKMRDRLLDRSLSVRFFDILVRSMVTMADTLASLAARLGFRDLGPLAIASPVPANNGFQQARPVRRGGHLLPLDLRSELAGVASGQTASAA